MKEERKTKYNLIKMVLLIVVTMFMFSTPVQAAKLNKTSLTLVKGKTYTLKLKGTKKKATWKTKNKKIAKLSNKKKSSVKIKAVKAGKTTVTAKVGKKTYKCKVTVVNKKKTSKSKTNTDNKDNQTSDKKNEQVADKPSSDKTEQTPEKKKVWIVTKWGEHKTVQRGVNPYQVYECWCGVVFKEIDYGIIPQEDYYTDKDLYYKAHSEHYWEHALKDENTGHICYTAYEYYVYDEYDYPEEGYWIEIGADEYPEGLMWRSDEEAKKRTMKDTKTGVVSQPTSGYYYIDKSGN